MMGLIDRRSITNFDWILLIISLILTIAGLYTLFCAVMDGPQEVLFWRQLTWSLLGLGIILLVICIDYNFWCKFAYVFYALTLLSLIYLFVEGTARDVDVNRWLKIGFLPMIQPSEFLKLALIMMLSKYFHTLNKFTLSLKDLIIPLTLCGIPFFLVVSQPDLGTALSLIPICLIIIYVAGYKFRNMVLWGIVLTIPLMVTAKYVLKPYQIKRLTTFINPQADIKGAGWHAVMSQISVGSGGSIGKIGQETRLYQRGFLPEQHTDFIFSVWAEEMGFIGSVMVVLLFVLLLRKGIMIAQEAKEPLGIYLSIGIITMIGFQAFFNMGMVIGIFPITGLPLPFFSYGGSHHLTTSLAIGILLNIRMRRYIF